LIDLRLTEDDGAKDAADEIELEKAKLKIIRDKN
jgi:hypothetical protein